MSAFGNLRMIALTVAILGPSSSCAFVPFSFPRGIKQGVSNKAENWELYESIYGLEPWRLPGKPDGHPDHKTNNNNIDLEPEPWYETRREVARYDVEPLAQEDEESEEEALPFGWDAQAEDADGMEEEIEDQTVGGDAQLNALLEEAERLGEEVKMRFEEEKALLGDAGNDSREGEAELQKIYQSVRNASPLITDPESILDETIQESSEVQDAQGINVNLDEVYAPDELRAGPDDQDTDLENEVGGDIVAGQQLSSEELYEEDLMRRGIEKARLLAAESARRRAEEEAEKVEMKMKSVEAARLRNAEIARIRAEQEQARVLAQAEARKQGIEAARRMREESARREDERYERVVVARQEAMDAALHRVEERARMEDEEDRLIAEGRNWFYEGKRHEDREMDTPVGVSDDSGDEPEEADAEESGETSQAEPPRRQFAISDVMRIIG